MHLRLELCDACRDKARAYAREQRAIARARAGLEPNWLVPLGPVVHRIQLMLRAGDTYRSLGARVGVSPSTLCRMVNSYRDDPTLRTRRTTAERILERHRVDAWMASHQG